MWTTLKLFLYWQHWQRNVKSKSWIARRNWNLNFVEFTQLYKISNIYFLLFDCIVTKKQLVLTKAFDIGAVRAETLRSCHIIVRYLIHDIIVWDIRWVISMLCSLLSMCQIKIPVPTNPSLRFHRGLIYFSRKITFTKNSLTLM